MNGEQKVEKSQPAQIEFWCGLLKASRPHSIPSLCVYFNWNCHCCANGQFYCFCRIAMAALTGCSAFTTASRSIVGCVALSSGWDLPRTFNQISITSIGKLLPRLWPIRIYVNISGNRSAPPLQYPAINLSLALCVFACLQMHKLPQLLYSNVQFNILYLFTPL